MKQDELHALAQRFLAAWNSQDVEGVLSCYTPDLLYRDPNTRGTIQGSQGMRRYLTRLFEKWQMHWELREGFAFSEKNGAAILWHATFQRKGAGRVVEADGMDLVLLDGDLIARNEVYFDRLALSPLMGTTGRLFYYLTNLGRRKKIRM